MSYRQKLPLLALSFVAWAAGAWIALSSFVLNAQARTKPWTTNTTTHFWTGLALMVIALLEVFSLVSRSRAARAALSHSLEDQTASLAVEESPAKADDEMLVMLATALLKEIDTKSRRKEEEFS